MTAKPSLADSLKNVDARDIKQIKAAEEMLGPDPDTMGYCKNLFWGNILERDVFPYPESSAEETARCDQMLAALDDYLKNEHPSFEIDLSQEIPYLALKRLFEIAAMAMCGPQEYGGAGF